MIVVNEGNSGQTQVEPHALLPRISSLDCVEATTVEKILPKDTLEE